MIGTKLEYLRGGCMKQLFKSKSFIYLILPFIILIFTPFTKDSLAAESPANWPWRGINLEFPESTPNDIIRYKTHLNVNMIRFHIKIRKHAKESKLSGEASLDEAIKWADSMLDECKRQGITAVINIKQFPLNPDKPDDQTQQFWSDPSSRAEVLAVTKRLANHFRNRGIELAAYDMMSEPVIRTGSRSKSPDEWPELMQEIINVISIADNSRWVVVAPGPWGGPDGYKTFTPPVGNNLIWGVHMYKPHEFTHQGIRQYKQNVKYPGIINLRKWNRETLAKELAPLKAFQQKNGGLVWVGEFSAVRWADGGEQYIKDLVSIFDSNNWGWSYFSGSGWHGWHPDYNQIKSCLTANCNFKDHYLGNSSARWETLIDIYKQ